jgi:cell division protein FtsI/penicillin-binding protein 2
MGTVGWKEEDQVTGHAIKVLVSVFAMVMMIVVLQIWHLQLVSNFLK